MLGYSPSSDEFMSEDPEQLDEYREWQRFAKFILVEEQAKRLPCHNNKPVIIRSQKLRDQKIRSPKK